MRAILKVKSNKSLIDGVLNNRWDGKKYLYCFYSSLTSEERGNIISRLLEEQESCCCYCYKILSQNIATVEHLIPIATTPEVFAAYASEAIELKHNVCHQSEFNETAYREEHYRQPHQVAYFNLFAACEKCNNFRGDTKIKPIFYNSNVHLRVFYSDNGLIFSEFYNEEISAIQLNRADLKFFRSFWKLASKSFPDYLPADYELERFFYRFVRSYSNQRDIRRLELDYKDFLFKECLRYSIFYNFGH